MLGTTAASREMTLEEKAINEKPWNELTRDQKVEGLAMSVRGLQYLPSSIDGLRKTVEGLESRIHNQNGEVYVPLHQLKMKSGSLIGGLSKPGWI